jgi:uncharacterized membrane protein
MEAVIAVSFEDGSKAYEALTKLKELDGQGQVDVKDAGVVEREDDGHVEIKDETGEFPATGTVTGGLIGLLVGVLGGPLGILIGGSTGLLVGSLFDFDDSDDMESVLADLAKSLRTGEPSLLAEVAEQSPDVIDTAMAALGGTVMRRSLDDVEAEIAAAEEAEKQARKAARKTLHEQRRSQAKEKVDAKLAELKAKLHHHKATAAAS